MSTATDDLQAALASFRTRSSELWNWRAVYRYTDEAEQGVGELTGLARLHGAAITIPYVEKAIASAFRVLMRADDSNGGIQIVIQELLELHQQLCLVEAPDVDRLVAWLQKFEFGETGEYFSIDIIGYAVPLGVGGLDRYRRALQRREAALTVPFVRGPLGYASDDEWLARHALLRNYRRLAVLDRDEAELVRLYTGEHEHARDLRDGAAALSQAGFPLRAIDLSRAGIDARGSYVDQQRCAEEWLRLLTLHRPAEVTDAARLVFARWPRADYARRLEAAVGATAWQAERERALDRMRPAPHELIPYLLGAGDPERAWTEAHRAAASGNSLSVRLWDAVIDDYRYIDPAAVLPVMQHVLEELLRVADTAKYADAVKRMKALLHVARAAGTPEVGEQIVAELRERFRRRTSLIARMDRARLP